MRILDITLVFNLLTIKFLDVYRVTTSAGADWIRINWRTSSSILQQQLRSVEIVITSQCFTGIVATATQTFSVTPDEGNSFTVTGLSTYVHATYVLRDHLCMPF